MPSVIFYDPKPSKVREHDFSERPCVTIELCDGFPFMFHHEDIETLDELVALFTEAREKLARLRLRDAHDVPAAQVEVDDLIFFAGQARRVTRVVVASGLVIVSHKDGSIRMPFDQSIQVFPRNMLGVAS